MLYKSHSSQKINMKNVWNKFVLSGKVDEDLLCNDIVRSDIIESWIRCFEANVNHLNGFCCDILSEENIRILIEEKKQLIEIAKPIMKTLYKCVQGNSFVVVLTNENGRILETMGDAHVLEMTKTINFLPGGNWSEASVGTNAIGTALALNKPIQVSGAEHYCSEHHIWTCSAAPIHNSSGNVIGCLDMSCHVGRDYSHDLGMVIAAVRAIENQLHKEELQEKLYAAHKHLTILIGTISEGIMSIDKNKVITHVNPAFCRIFGMPIDDMINKTTIDIIGENDSINSVLESGTPCLEEELVIDVLNKRVNCIFKSEPIIDKYAQIAGAVITFREMKQIHQIVNKISGSIARFRFADIVGDSIMMQEGIKKAKIASQSSSTVLLLGESGTGKEVFAQAIHNASCRREGPFIAVNCAAMPRELIQSELFGYSDGTFTGARKGGRPGKFELANEGTLLLDEIGDMPLDMQVNLLRVLQEKNIVRVGGDKTIPVDVRVIASTNRNLSIEVEKGNFRKDLFYRLNVFSINIPPLRERTEDIKVFAEYFTKKMGVKLGKEICTICPEVYEVFNNYHWPGNVREMENVLEYAINIAEKNIITKKCLPAYLTKIKDKINKKIEKNCEIISLQALECEAIDNAIKKYGGNITKAAQTLGIARNTFYEKMKKCNINKNNI